MHWKDKQIIQNHTFSPCLGLCWMLCGIYTTDSDSNASNKLGINSRP